MNREQAEEIAQAMLQEASSGRKATVEKIATRNSVTNRVRTAIITLLGFGFGWRASESLFGSEDFAPLVALVIALSAAVVFPSRRLT